MIYIIPTKRGIGVELWGTYHDLSNFYEVINKFWNDETKQGQKGVENRDMLISGFSYEIRNAKEGKRLKRSRCHFLLKESEHLGVQISWIHFLFSLTAIKFNMRSYETNKFDIAMILQIEFWLEKAMRSYDSIVANKLIGYIEDGLYGGNEYIYQYMRSLNLNYFLLGGGKKAFKQLPNLLRQGVFFSDEYKSYAAFLQKEAQRLNCDISELEVTDDHIDYESIKW